MDSVSAAGGVSTDVTSPRPRAGANTAAVGSEGTCVASPPTVTCPSSSSLPAKPVGILELALPGLGRGWTWPWVGQRGQRGCAGLWDRGHPEPLGTTRVTLFRSMSLYLPAQQERVSSPCPGSLDLLGSGRGRSVCCSLPGAGREGSVSLCTQAATGARAGPKSTRCSQPSCPSREGHAHQCPQNLEDRLSPG